jgi:hypothetical protein
LELWARIVCATFLATAITFTIHVLYGRGLAENYVQYAAQLGRIKIISEPYPFFVVAIASITALIPTSGKVALYFLVRHILPGRSRIVKGLWFGILLLAIGDGLIRNPIMSFVVGNPVDVVFVQSLEACLLPPLTGIVIATCLRHDRQYAPSSAAPESASRPTTPPHNT